MEKLETSNLDSNKPHLKSSIWYPPQEVLTSLPHNHVTLTNHVTVSNLGSKNNSMIEVHSALLHWRYCHYLLIM